MLAEDRENTVAILRFENPPANALSNALIDALNAALARAAQARDVRAVVLTGAGSRFFSAGGDIKELEHLTLARAAERVGAFHETLMALDEFPKPLVAAANGHAVGGAFELCLFCDVTIGTAGARFGFPEINHGILPVAKGMQRAVQRLGPAAASRLLYRGELIDAREAMRLGVLDEVVAPEAVLDRAVELAASLGAKDPTLFAAIKRTLSAAWTDAPEDQRARALSDLERYFQSDGMRAGVATFHARG